MVKYRFRSKRVVFAIAWMSVLATGVTGTASAEANEWSSRNSFELAFTDNANLSQSNRIADTYYRLATGNTVAYDEHTVGIHLSYRDFMKENQNDFLSLRIADVWRPADSVWKYTSAVVGHVFPSGAIGNTDTAFDNYGFDISMTRTKEISSQTSLDFGGGSRSRFYPTFSGRFDENIYGLAELDHEVNKRLLLSADAEGGLVLSGLSEYSKFYVSLGGAADYDLLGGWSLYSHLGLDQAFFLNRTVSTQTAVTRRRGQVVTGQVESLETHSRIVLGVEASRRVNSEFSFAFGINSIGQSSASGLENYSELQILGRLSYVF